MKYSIFIIGILMIMSCDNENNKISLVGKYEMLGDTCKQIKFQEENKLEYKKSCEEVTGSGVNVTQLNGEVKELYCTDKLKYEIIKFGKNGGIYFEINDKNNNKCRGIHLLKERGYIILTELKSGEGINFHYAEPKIFKEKGNRSIEFSKEKLIIKIPKGKNEGLNYIAFNQKEGERPRIDEDGNIYLEMKEVEKLKSTLEINPKHFALKTYEFREEGNKVIPMFYHREYQKLRTMSIIDQEKYKSEKGIEKGGRYIVLHRFNPGRKRVVNKIFAEEIIGQVQSFELIVNR